MALNERTLKKSLETGAVVPVYLIFGNDAFLKKQAVDRIVKATVGAEDDLNLLRYAYGCDLQQIYDELNGFPVMADKKCVVLNDFEIDSCSKSEFDRLCELAGDPYETSVFVLYFDTVPVDLKKSDRAKKLIAAAEKAGGVAVVLDHRSREELIRLLCASAKKQGCDLPPDVAGYLIDSTSQEISVLANEMTKLCAYAAGKPITRETVDLVAVKSVEASVYNLSAKILSGDTTGAMRLLDDLYFMRIEPEIILYQIAAAFVDMVRVYAAEKQGIHPQTAAADFKMKGREFVLKRAAGNLRRYNETKLNLSFDALLAADKELKSFSSDGRLVIEKLIVKLIYIMKTGEALD